MLRTLPEQPTEAVTSSTPAPPPPPLLLTCCCCAGLAQVLASNVTALVWNTYMSFMSNRKVEVKKA
jgi:hypothetical protein